MTTEYDLSIRCFYAGSDNYTQHRQSLRLKDIPKWVEAYKFTHPAVQSISIKIWLNEDDAE